MKRISVSLSFRNWTLGLTALCAAALIASLRPTSGPRELLLLALLSLMAVIPVSLLVYQHSNKMFRALRVARREHSMFKAAAEESLRAFVICKPVCNSQGKVVDYRFSFTNRSAERLIGKDRRALVRRSVQEAFVAKGGEPLTVIFARVAGTAKKEVIELELLREGAEPQVFEAHVEPLGSCVALAIGRQDLQEITSERIRELQDFASSIIESAPISMIATDAAGTIIAVNSAAEQLTRYRRHDLIQQHSLTVLHDSAELSARTVELNRNRTEQLKAGFDALTIKPEEGTPEQREWTYVRKDNTRVWVNLTMTPLQTPDKKVTGHLGIAFDVTERKLLTDSIVHMARHDQLTGLPNRSVLKDHLEQGILRAKRSSQRLAVFMVDVDHFKRINDSLGHGAGDEVLVFVAKQLSSSLRSTDTVARVGGDEFIVVMQDFGDAADAERCADLMLQKICTPILVDEREVRMTASIGLCLYPEDAGTATDLLRRADVAMYEAKNDGRGCVRAFSIAMLKEAADRLAMEEELRHALIANEFELHYQPQVSCATGRVNGMEMLLRWNSPKRGSVSPALFIPVAEEAGLMVQIGEWGVAQACRDCVFVQQQLGTSLRVAVNLSPRQFSQRNLTSVVRQALADSGLPAGHFELELTEQMLMANTPCVMRTLREIRDLGVGIAIDDFGTGFSSFSYILEYQVDRLKIDRSFVSRVHQDDNAAAIVRAIIAMGRGLNIELVAEGVETEEQFAFLKRKHCETVQGFLFSRAVPIQQFCDKVREIEAGLSNDGVSINGREQVHSDRVPSLQQPRSYPHGLTAQAI